MSNSLLHLENGYIKSIEKNEPVAYIDLETIKNFDDVVNHPSHKGGENFIEAIRYISMHHPLAGYRSSMAGFVFDERIQKYKICFVETYDQTLEKLQESYFLRKQKLLTSKL